MANEKVKDLTEKTPLVSTDEFYVNDVAGGNVDKKGNIAGIRITESQITDLQSYLTAITGENIGDLSDVTNSSTTNRNVLVHNGSGALVSRALVEADISDLQSYLTDITAEASTSLTDTSNIVYKDQNSTTITGDNWTHTLPTPTVNGEYNNIIQSDSGAVTINKVFQEVRVAKGSTALANTSGFVGSSVRGTLASPTRLLDGDRVSAYGYGTYGDFDGSGVEWNRLALIDVRMTGDFTDGVSHPVEYLFQYSRSDNNLTSHHPDQIKFTGDGRVVARRGFNISDDVTINAWSDTHNELQIILGGDLGGSDRSATIPALTADDTFAFLGIANNFSQNQTIVTDASTPSLILKRTDSTPTDFDGVGTVFFQGPDSLGNNTEYGKFRVSSRDVTDGTEDGQFIFDVTIAGVSTGFLRANVVNNLLDCKINYSVDSGNYIPWGS